MSRQLPPARRITVSAGGVSYEAIVGPGLLPHLGAELARLLPRARGAVIADSNSAPLFGATVTASLAAAGYTSTLITVPAGEASKSLAQIENVTAQMTAAGLDRSSFLVALGGGVIGDLAGFAAAIYHRGIPHVQIPTTLLAQVDSSIGGKTAVNTAAGKNLLGAVHQPALVLADVASMHTLPERELRQGLAEIIKHAIIADPSLFALLEPLDRSDLTELVCRNIAIKAGIVAKDEQDRRGTRAVLNFGHTIGHALERAGEYRRFLHGEAIGLGMVAACEVSVRKAGLPAAARARVIAALEAQGLPTRLPTDFPRAAILPALAADKKFEQGEVRFVVTPHLGAAHLTSDVTLADLKQAIDSLG